MNSIDNAKNLFAAAIANGATEEQAAQQVWQALKPAKARAKHWGEAIAHSGTSVRWYKCPLGSLLGITPAAIGSHSARWPRTKQSKESCADWQAVVLQALRGEGLKGKQ